MPQLDTATFLPQIVWLLLIFGIFYAVSSWVIVPRMQRIFALRDERLKKTLEEAEELKRQIDLMDDKITVHREQAQKQAQLLIKERVEAFSAKNQELEKKFMDEIEKRLRETEETLKQNAAAFDQRADQIVEELVRAIFLKLVDQETTGDTVKKTMVKVRRQ
jgi:F-type H+-transporting ATPase subunit b